MITVQKMERIILRTKSKEEAKTLFTEFTKNFPSLEFISWELVTRLISGDAWVRNHFESALELGSYGQWSGRYELVRNGVIYTLSLIPYVGDRRLIISCDPEGDYPLFMVVVDYTERPTGTHQYSELGVREYVLEEDEEFVPRAPQSSDEENDVYVVAVVTAKEPHEEDDDPKYWGESQH